MRYNICPLVCPLVPLLEPLKARYSFIRQTAHCNLLEYPPLSRLPRHKVLFYRAKVLRRENAKYRFANNSVELTTTFHECAISGISLTPCLFTCLISLFALSLMHIKQIPVAKSEGFQAEGNKNKSNNKNLRLCRIGAALRMR